MIQSSLHARLTKQACEKKVKVDKQSEQAAKRSALQAQLEELGGNAGAKAKPPKRQKIAK